LVGGYEAKMVGSDHEGAGGQKTNEKTGRDVVVTRRDPASQVLDLK